MSGADIGELNELFEVEEKEKVFLPQVTGTVLRYSYERVELLPSYRKGVGTKPLSSLINLIKSGLHQAENLASILGGFYSMDVRGRGSRSQF